MIAKTIIAAPEGGLRPITVEDITKHFELRDGVIYWRQGSPQKAKTGAPAGHKEMRPYCIDPEKLTETNLYLGVKIGFRYAFLKGEDVAFTLHHGRFPKGKVVHKDGNRVNNAPENLIEIGK